MSNVPLADLRPDQYVYGRVPGASVWSSAVFRWKEDHPRVQDGTVPMMVEQLLTANQFAIGLGINDFWTRQSWLGQWARNNLSIETMVLPLPELDLEP